MDKMKLNIAALLLSGLTLSSCMESFLDVESKTQSNTGNSYKTTEDANLALTGCYNGWKRTTSDDTWGFYICSEVMADECLAGTGVSDKTDYQVVDRFDIGRYAAGTSLLETAWDSYYRAIYRCNELIKYDGIGQIDWNGDEAARGRTMGEARAIRAFCYFDMVRLWENIPLLTEPTDANVPQAKPDEVYAVIVEDLRYAIAHIPANAYPKAGMKDNDGRITKYAAEALMARVYLFYTGYYGKDLGDVTKNEVVGYLDDIIKSDEYQLIDFKDLWPAASSVSSPDSYTWDTEKTTYKELNDEVILQMKFNYTDDRYNADQGGDIDGNRWLVMLGLRKFWYSPYAYGWGCCTVHPKLWNAYSSNDVRRSASIIDMKGEGIAAKKGFDEYLKDQREYTGYAVKKYTPTCFYDGTSSVPEQTTTSAVQENQYQPYIVLRYADVLLMAAELGGTPSMSAQACLDAVRKRAGLSSVAPTPENIMNERMLEFAFEGIRYWDLLRQGVDYAASQIAESGLEVLSGNQKEIVTIDADKIKSKRGLMQIPQNQITLSNGLLKQNAGW